MTPTEPEFPARLIEGDEPEAVLLRQALAEPRLGPSEEQSFRRLQERKARATTRWLVPALVGAAALAALAVWSRGPRPEPLLVTPDTWHSAPAPQANRASQRSAAQATLPAPSAVPSAARVEPRPSSDAEADADACSKLAQGGKYRDATACYARIARGSSMAAELSLYEKARLEAKALNQKQQALTTLSEHARRFPNGLLSSEVGMTRIELLSQLGRRPEALSAIERALDGALGRERGGDLQVLRADLLAAQGDCAHALEAVMAAKSAGVHPSRLDGIERRCSSDENGEH